MTSDRDRKMHRLKDAEVEIAAGEVRVSDELTRIEQLHADGGDTKVAQARLTRLETTLEGWRKHHEGVLRSGVEIDAEQTLGSDAQDGKREG